jgi:CysZ protein
MDAEITTPNPFTSARKTAAKTFARKFLDGFATPWRGFQYMRKHPKLWAYGWAPVLINLAITTLTLLGLIAALIYGIQYIHANATPDWWGRTLEVVYILALIVGAIGITLAVYFLLASALCGYFYSLLAHEVEKQLGIDESTIKDVPVSYQILDAGRDFLTIAGTAIGCFFLGCIPLVGGVVGACVSFYVDCFVFGYDYLDLPMALRGQRRKDKRAFARQHRPQVLGLGLIVFLFNFIPILGSVMLTTAATGAVLLHRQLIEDSPPPTEAIQKA